jgi:hypothetical protein
MTRATKRVFAIPCGIWLGGQGECHSLGSSDYITVGTHFLIRYANCTCRNEHSQEFTYTTRWDSDKIKGCQCDYPATGFDCSQQLCPPGDDPLTPGQVGNLVTQRELV